jgi:hypothetical protein
MRAEIEGRKGSNGRKKGELLSGRRKNGEENEDARLPANLHCSHPRPNKNKNKNWRASAQGHQCVPKMRNEGTLK